MSKASILSLMIVALTGAAAPAHADTFSSMVVFGDSLSDVGNLYFESGGVFPSFNPGVNPLFVYTAGRLTDGPDTFPATTLTGVWVEQLATKLGVATPTASLAGGTNYAYGGATSGTGFTPLNGGPLQAENVGSQVGQYLGTNIIDSNALYILGAGSNDIAAAADAGMTASQIIAAAVVAEAQTQAEVASLLQAGAQHVLWVSVPPLDLTPDFNVLSPEHSAVQQASTAFHNQWLTDLNGLQLSAPGALIGLDAYTLLQDVSANPSNYGLTNVTSPALLDAQSNPALNPDKYLFWDGEHPTTAGHQVLANAAFTALVPEPATLALLAAGLMLQGCRRRRKA